MHLYDIPLAFALVGLAFYVVLGGADFGAALWQAGAGHGERAEQLRDHAHHAMSPVWEANHVWLIFVLTVVWTAYPVAFGSIASTLSIPLFIAAVGIIVRGAAYALRSATRTRGEQRLIDSVSSLSSLLTPFALGAAVGGIASRRVPVGNAAGDLVSSWTNPTSLVIGALAVSTSAYTAAVFLAGDAVRRDEPDLEGPFRRRALGAGVVAGVLAAGSLVVLHADAQPLFHRLVAWPGRAGLVVSAVAGLATLGLVWARRYEPARYTAGLAVAAIIAGWALAQQPTFLAGLTIGQAAAPHDTLVAVTVAIIAGGVLLFPSLALLFRLTLTGRLDEAPSAVAAPERPRRAVFAASTLGALARLAGALAVAGVGFLTVAESAWAHGVGVACLLGFVAVAFVAVAPAELAAQPVDGSEGCTRSPTHPE